MAKQAVPTGLVFKFQRHSLHDGPGIRTLVFFKGCPLKCVWCFNPESQKLKPEIIHHPEKCIGCNLCMEACSITGAIELRKEAKKINYARCDGCGKCAKACLTGGMTQIGTCVDVEEVVSIIRKDKVFYDKSGGGVTLSGGEVTLQANFAAAVLEKCQSEHIHTAIETCGYSSWSTLKRLLLHTDLVLYDLKILDSEKHRRFTGRSNETILENARKVAGSGIPTIVRIPVVPAYNDGDDDLRGVARFIRNELAAVQEVHLLPYELIGVAKYEKLQRKYILHEVVPPTRAAMERNQTLLESFGLKVRISG